MPGQKTQSLPRIDPENKKEQSNKWVPDGSPVWHSSPQWETAVTSPIRRNQAYGIDHFQHEIKIKDKLFYNNNNKVWERIPDKAPIQYVPSLAMGLSRTNK